MYFVTKTYGHELGLSACFRQWKATSHCRFLHGYPLSFKLTFGCADDALLDDWVINFGGLKEIKAWLCDTFDHKLLVAHDDPERERLEALMAIEWGTIRGGDNDGERVRMSTPESRKRQIADVLVIPKIGCEGFARYVFDHVFDWMGDNGHMPRVFLHSVEVREHGGNSAIYQNEYVK